MRRPRAPWMLLAAALSMAGCRAVSPGSLSGSASDAPPVPPPPAPPPAPDARPVPPSRSDVPPPPADPVVAIPAPDRPDLRGPDPWLPGPCCPDPLRVPDPTRPYLNAYVGFSPSVLPNLGLAVEAGMVTRRDPQVTWAFEFQGTWQFLDDKTFVDDGNPEAGDWYQVQLGFKASSHPLLRRHWTGRAGLVWFQANGVPNIVQEAGNYWGIYLAGGFEVDLTEHLTMGPSLTGMLVWGDDRLHVVPQFNWHVIWSF